MAKSNQANQQTVVIGGNAGETNPGEPNAKEPSKKIIRKGLGVK